MKFVEGLRVTDAAAMGKVARMVLVGKVSKEIVSLINRYGARAVGLGGDDGMLLEAEKLVRRGADGSILDRRHGGRGRVCRHRVAGYVGVRLRARGCIGGDRPHGDKLQHQRRHGGCCGGGALKAEKLVFLTDVVGLLADVDDDGSLVSECSAADLEAMMESGQVSEA